MRKWLNLAVYFGIFSVALWLVSSFLLLGGSPVFPEDGSISFLHFPAHGPYYLHLGASPPHEVGFGVYLASFIVDCVALVGVACLLLARFALQRLDRDASGGCSNAR